MAICVFLGGVDGVGRERERERKRVRGRGKERERERELLQMSDIIHKT